MAASSPPSAGPPARTDRRVNTSGSRPPETILQFGTGVFLLGFADWIVEQLNRKSGFAGGIVAFKARPGSSASLAPLNRHGGEFHVWLRGYAGEELVDRVDSVHCLRRAINPFADYAAALQVARSAQLQWVISNTTEAGIHYRQQASPQDGALPDTFPALLTALLYERFRQFDGAAERGLAILCCELIENNAASLLAIVQRHAADWGLPAQFTDWLEASNAFCNTLVDRIVTGETAARPGNVELPEGALVIEAEAFHAWVIEAPAWVRGKLPVADSGLQVEFVDDLRAYRERKVRVLNGAHTATFALSLMAGVPTVYQSMQTAYLRAFLESLLRAEIAPTLGGDSAANRQYIDAILQRFDNPYLEHRWQDIALNALSKWRARLLPTLCDVQAQRGDYPPLLSLSLAALLAFYRGSWCGEQLPVRDDPEAIARIQAAFSAASTEAAVASVLGDAKVWGTRLPPLPGLAAQVAAHIAALEEQGVEGYLRGMVAA